MLNVTAEFYKGASPSLFWEMTVCQTLTGKGAAMAALSRPMAYGEILARFVTGKMGAPGPARVLEIGGGYGSLMEAFAEKIQPAEITMADISPRFLDMQKKALARFANVSFVLSDAGEFLSSCEGFFDLVIANENMGDMDTATDLDRDALLEMAVKGPPYAPDETGRAARLVSLYGLDLPEETPVTVNVGALELIEKLKGRARAAFLSEHSANAKAAPPYEFLVPVADGKPRAIKLAGHIEYSIDFDHAEKVARMSGFNVERLSMLEFLKVRTDEGARFMAAAQCAGMGNAEEIHEFLNHVKEYECMFLTA